MASCFTNLSVGRGQRAGSSPGPWGAGPSRESLTAPPRPFPPPRIYSQPLTLWSQREGRGWELGRGPAPSASHDRRRGPQGAQDGGLWVSRQGRTGTEC